MTVTIVLRRRPDAPSLPDHEYWTKTPFSERVYLSYEDFETIYGASRQDVQKVLTGIRDVNLRVASINYARRCVKLTGIAAQFNSLFGVDLFYFQLNQQEYISHERPITLPQGWEEFIENILGLDTRPRLIRQSYDDGYGAATAVEIANLKEYYHFPEWNSQAAYYNVVNWTAEGEVIGLAEFDGGYYKTADGKAEDPSHGWINIGIPSSRVISWSVDGGLNSPGIDQGPDREVVGDIFMAGAFAPDSKIVAYFASGIGTRQNHDQFLVDMFDTMIHPGANDSRPSVISCSWAFFEEEDSAQTMYTLDEKFKEAAALGITIFCCTGDWGTSAVNVATYEPLDNRAHVYFPASSPWVTACGGTIITDTKPYGSNFTEKTWNDSAATGGGISDYFDLPYWQSGYPIPKSANGDGRVGRGIPDISANASFYSPYPFFIYQQLDYIGGTSMVAPLYAGFIALCNAQLKRRVGFLNPLLYSDKAKDAIREIADDGNNLLSIALDGTPFYSSAPVWNACTGLGVLDGMKFFELIDTPIARHQNSQLLDNVALINRLKHGGEWPDWTGPIRSQLEKTLFIHELSDSIQDTEVTKRIKEITSAQISRLVSELNAGKR
jgi:kumamolisin